MRDVLKNLALFIIFSIVISSAASCNRTSTSGNNAVSANNSVAQAPPANTEPTEKKASPYPPLKAAIANADMENLDGTISHIADRKGKVLLLNMWGTWCGPCRAEMPDLVALQQKYGPQGFEVIGMNIGDGEGKPEDMAKIKTFGENMKLNYTLVRIPNTLTGEFYRISKEQVVPQSFLINRDGELRGVFTGGGPRITNLVKETVAKVMNGDQSPDAPATN
jgi:thiol-disulfide isomerase/thioredoxin